MMAFYGIGYMPIYPHRYAVSGWICPLYLLVYGAGSRAKTYRAARKRDNSNVKTTVQLWRYYNLMTTSRTREKSEERELWLYPAASLCVRPLRQNGVIIILAARELRTRNLGRMTASYNHHR